MRVIKEREDKTNKLLNDICLYNFLKAHNLKTITYLREKGYSPLNLRTQNINY